MHGNTGLRRSRLCAGAAMGAGVRRLRRGRVAVGVVRRASCVSTSRRRRAVVRADRVPGGPAGGGRRGGVVPAPRDAAPDLPLAADAARRRPAAAAAVGGARDRPGRAAGRRRVLRLRRDVRGQERRHVDGDAVGQAAARARHPRRGVHVGRQLLPDAHRRRAAAPACRRADDAPRGDPGGAPNEGLSRGGARDAAERAAAPQPRQGDDDDPRQAAAGDRRAAGLGGAARRRRGDQGACDGDAAGAARAARGVGRARRRCRALGARRRGGERDRGVDRSLARRVTRS